jgi:excisionase family DNA binding protein
MSTQSLQQHTTQSSPPGNEWMTAEEAAAYLKVKVRTLQLWARQGKIRGFILSGNARHVWRFRREDLDAALMASSVVPSLPPSVRFAEQEAV